MKRKYLVDGFFNFEKEANSPEELKEFIYKILEKEEIENKNFTIDISRVSGKGEPIEDIVKNKGEENQPEIKQKRKYIKRKK